MRSWLPQLPRKRSRFSIQKSSTLVISDHLLPGASGAELADRIKAERPDEGLVIIPFEISEGPRIVELTSGQY